MAQHTTHHAEHTLLRDGDRSGEDALAEGSGSAASPPAPPSRGQLQMSSFIDGGDGQQQHQQQVASLPGLNVQAAGMSFQDDVPVAVQEAVRTFQAPPGYTIATIGSRRKKHSITAYYGARLEFKPPGGEPMPAGKRRQKWAFLASHECRSQINIFSIHSDHTIHRGYAALVGRAQHPERCCSCWHQAETTSVGGEGCCAGKPGVQRQPEPIPPTAVREELHCPRCMSVQHSGTQPDPALSVVVVPRQAPGRWPSHQSRPDDAGRCQRVGLCTRGGVR